MTTRRDVLLGSGALLGTSLFHDRALAQVNGVKLLLIREAGYQNKCVSCIQGKIYGVPTAIDLSSAEQATGLLTFITDAVELSYEENKSEASSIPEGTYSAKVREDGSKRWMWSKHEIGKGSILVNRAWRLELNVPKRPNIQFHYGKDVKWSVGCIILGLKLAQCSTQNQCSFPDSPETAVEALRGYVIENSLSAATTIKVRIASA